MEINLKDNPITIKTIEVNGKKLTKSAIQQFELEELCYIHLKDKHLRSINNLTNEFESEMKDYKMYGSIIGWINLKFDKDNIIKEMLQRNSYHFDSDVYTVLFISNSKPDVINRTYISKLNYNKLFLGLYPQLIIG